MRKKRYQKGSLQCRKHGRTKVWVALWWQGSSRRFKTLGRCSEMNKGGAMERLAEILQSLKPCAREDGEEVCTLSNFVKSVYLPFQRKKWKNSTSLTSEQRIRCHLISELGAVRLDNIRREHLQEFLDRKAASGLSFSVVDHLRWDLRAILDLAVEDKLIDRNPARSLYTPSSAVRGEQAVMNKEQVSQLVDLLERRERLIAKLAIFAGMRPGEIFGLQLKHVVLLESADQSYVEVRQRIYKGRLGSPKSPKSIRKVGLSPGVLKELREWIANLLDTRPEAWLFPSERISTPLSKDNCWRRHMERKLRGAGLDWANFQVMRRTYSSLSKKEGVDSKVLADQLGHGLGVNLDVYTHTDLAQKAAAVRKLESALVQ